MIKIDWLRNALRNLQSIHSYYVDQEAQEQAVKIILLIERTVNQLRNFPMLGRPGKVEGTRELVVTQTPYVVIYKETSNKIQILRILHSSQKWPKINE